MKINIRISLTVAAVLLAFNVSAVSADEITIQDTSGFTRASSNVDGKGKVEFSVAALGGSAADGIPVTLTNAATGEILTGTSANGLVAFEGISGGVWTVSTSAQGITFTNVMIIGAATGGGIAGAGALVPALLIGGGATGAAIAIDNSGNNNNEISPAS